MLNERASNSKKMFIILGVVIVALAAAAAYFFWQFQQAKANPNAENEETSKRVVMQIGRLYALPTDEQPTVARVEDKDKLKEQSFFNKSENGDYIVIYKNNKLALLYREKDNKLINVGPISAGEQTAAKPNVVIMNGSGDAAKLGKAVAKVGGVASVTVGSSNTDAKNKNTAQTIVVDVGGSHGDSAAAVAQALGAQVVAMPAGETAPAGADIIVIVGKNQQ